MQTLLHIYFRHQTLGQTGCLAVVGPSRDLSQASTRLMELNLQIREALRQAQTQSCAALLLAPTPPPPASSQQSQPQLHTQEPGDPGLMQTQAPTQTQTQTEVTQTEIPMDAPLIRPQTPHIQPPPETHIEEPAETHATVLSTGL